jgi:hypothetical protein
MNRRDMGQAGQDRVASRLDILQKTLSICVERAAGIRNILYSKDEVLFGPKDCVNECANEAKAQPGQLDAVQDQATMLDNMLSDLSEYAQGFLNKI